MFSAVYSTGACIATVLGELRRNRALNGSVLGSFINIYGRCISMECQNTNPDSPSTTVLVLFGTRPKAVEKAHKGGPVKVTAEPDQDDIWETLEDLSQPPNRLLLVHWPGCEDFVDYVEDNLDAEVEVVDDGDLSLTCGDAFISVRRRKGLAALFWGRWKFSALAVLYHCDACVQQLSKRIRKQEFSAVQQELMMGG